MKQKSSPIQPHSPTISQAQPQTLPNKQATEFSQNSAICWINGKQCLPAEATLSIFDHGVLYGDGVFEGIRFFNRKPLLLTEHLDRLFASADGVEITIPYSPSQLTATINALCQEANIDSGYIRLVVTRGEGALGLNPIGCGPANTFIILDKLQMMPAYATREGISTIIAKTQRISANALNPRIKSLNYLNNILAKQEANKAGVNEAILLNSEGNVAEAVAENIIIFTGGKVLTPPCSDGALDGITCRTILKLAEKAGIASQITSISTDELLNADEVILTGTGAGLIPVCSINGLPVRQSPGPLFIQLNELYSHFIKQ